MSKVKGILKEVNPQHTFIWITDGLGWKKTQKPLREAFDTIDYILNLAMLEKGSDEFITAIFHNHCVQSQPIVPFAILFS